MGTCKFSIPFSGDASEIVSKARNTVEQNGGVFNGDNIAGSFDISLYGNTIKGSYAINGVDLEITIDEKPFLLSCSMIESFLKSKIQ